MYRVGFDRQPTFLHRSGDQLLCNEIGVNHVLGFPLRVLDSIYIICSINIINVINILMYVYI